MAKKAIAQFVAKGPSSEELTASQKNITGGFTLRTALTSFVLGMFMMPGVMYLSLVVGASLGPAGRYVAVILFMEVMRRSRRRARRSRSC